MFLSYNKKANQAKRNAQQSKGFVCPTCDSLVPRGFEICYNCGEDVIIAGSRSYSGGANKYDIMIMADIIFFIYAFIAPIFYLLSNIDDVFNILIFFPNLIILYFSSTAFLMKKKRKNLGYISGTFRAWVLFFSFFAFLNSVQIFIH